MPLLNEPHILIVDDEDSVRLALARWFGLRGFVVTEAVDGQDAVDRVRSGGPFDLIIMDLEMPRLHGLEAMDTIRKEQPDLPVVVLSGYAREKAKAWDHGAVAVLSKPIRLAALEGEVRRVLSGEAEGDS